ncbi:MAG: hypothetical protein HQL95_15440, partial [Magnetococcales bacterium]|nr:hypothetical protein [Magnetococcales bacterium]
LLAGNLLWSAAPVPAAEAVPSEEELVTQCKQFAIEDQVPPKEVDAYVTQCVLDLKEQYLPIGGMDNPIFAPPIEGLKDIGKDPAKEPSKEPSKAKEPPKDPAKEPSKAKEPAKEPPKEPAKEPPKPPAR